MQNFFYLARNLSVIGMNYSNKSSVYEGGETEVMKMLAKRFNENRAYFVFDVGANEGEYCTELLENIRIKDLQVYCFEPSGHAFGKLKSKHGSVPGVLLNNFGFSNKIDRMALYSNTPGSPIASLFPLERPFGAEEPLFDFEMVEIITIDHFLAESKISSVDFLKLDVEGNELNVLLGASQSISSGKIKAIQFEFGTCNIDSRTFFRDFWNLLSPRYNIYRVLKNGMYPITFYNELDEVFATINYFAELK